MDHSLSLYQFSKRLKRTFIMLLIMSPVLSILTWVFINHFSADLLGKFLPVKPNGELLVSSQLLGFAAHLFPLSVIMFGLYNLIKLFSLYERGIVFDSKNVLIIRRLGYAMILWFFSLIIYSAFVSIALTLHNPPGQRMLVIDVSLLNFSSMFIGLVLLALAKVMQKGQELTNEYAKVI